MALPEAGQLNSNMEGSLSGNGEAQQSIAEIKQGGWVTFPFITATIFGLTLAAWGWTANLIVYLIEEFHVKSIDATQISNVLNGCISLFPVIGAIIADSSLGCFLVISISSFISLLGTILICLTAALDLLKPRLCERGSTSCQSPSKFQLGILYLAMALASIGIGGTRFTLGTMGANQFDKPKHQGIFFNWFFCAIYASSMISTTAIVYVQDNVGWVWGFGICVGANIVAATIFLLGKGYFRHGKPQGSPFTDLARVVVAMVRKRKMVVSTKIEDYYYGQKGLLEIVPSVPTKSFRFLNRAAMKAEGDIRSDGTIAKQWTLSTVQQVEDLKKLIRIIPLWSTGIFLHTPIGIQSSLSVLQALAMDRHLGPHFQIPTGSILVFVLISTVVSLALFDIFLYPTWQKLIGRPLTPLTRIGVGHVLNVLSMTISALVESSRIKMNRTDKPNSVALMSVIWLVPQLVTVGIGEAFHFPGQVALYYQEFPSSLKSISTSMIALLIAIAFYLSTAIVDLVRRVTKWLPDNINNGRVDNVYWLLVVLGVLNFGYYLVCARFYKYQNVVNDGDNTTSG